MKAKKIAAGIMAAAMPVMMTLSVCDSVKADLLQYDGKYYADFSSWEEVEDAAAKLNIQVASEGFALLKNDNGALPFDSNVKNISVFGVRSDNIQVGGSGTGAIVGASASLVDTLAEYGYRVNPALVNFYGLLGNVNDRGYDWDIDISNYGRSVTESYALYHDAAVVIFSRTGGENADLSTATGEAADPGEHINGITSKHYLELTKNEEDLLKHVAENFDRVVLLVNSSNPVELKEIEKEEYGVDAVLWIGHPGENGIEAIGPVLSGEVNPSGRLVDTIEYDFTASPLWNNYGTGAQAVNNDGTLLYDAETNPYVNIYRTENGEIYGTVPNGNTPGSGYTEVQYEEGIYMGYRFYETMAYEMNRKSAGSGDDWYDGAVQFPFGYGLSYTTFNQKILGVFKDEAGTQELKGALSAADAAELKTVYVCVEVENTGDRAGKEVVQIYNNAPYFENEIEKSSVQLVGFEKTGIIPAGGKEIVAVAINLQDMASFDYNDANGNGTATYELDYGAYHLIAGKNSHEAFDSYTLAIGDNSKGAVVLDKDDFSGAEVKALFSETDPADPMFDYNLLDYAVEDGQAVLKMNLVSRMDFINGTYTQPEAASPEELKRSDEWFAAAVARDNYSVADDKADGTAGGGYAGQPWAEYSLPATWTQGTGVADENGLYPILFSQMNGINMYDAETVFTEENAPNPAFVGMTGEKAWETFMNQLTWDELLLFIGNGTYHTAGIPSVGKKLTKGMDGPIQLKSAGNGGGFGWAAEPLQAQTFNKELEYQVGQIIGNEGLLGNCQDWYGPAMDTHRSHFLGRTFEYYSEDGILAGYMAAAEVGGATSKGMNCYIKHFVLNDQEIYRKGISTFVTEQAFREIYCKPFQMAVQEGNAFALMTSFNRVGNIAAAVNYVLIQNLLRDEWGFDGAIVTDMFNINCWPLPMLLRAGNDLPLSGAKVYDGTWDASLRDGLGGVMVSTISEFSTVSSYSTGDKVRVTTHQGRTDIYNYYEFVTDHAPGAWDETHVKQLGAEEVASAVAQSDEQYYYLRLNAQRALYMAANSSSNENGVDTAAFKNAALENAVQGATYQADLSVAKEALKGSSAIYAIKGGQLPAGLSLNQRTGVISGTSTEAGSYKFTVKMTAAGWVSKEAEFTLDVDSAFKFESAGDAKVGEEFYGALSSDTITGAFYSLAGGLPEGLSFKAETGEIEGTPSVAGDYVANIIASVTAGRTTTQYSVLVPISVQAGEASGDALATKLAELEEKVSALASGTELAAVKADLDALKNAPAAVDESRVKSLEGKIADLEAANAVTSGMSTEMILSIAALAAGIVAIILSLVGGKKKQ